jgi:acetyl-CoA carboxylase carboxyltransferase component
MAHEKMLEELSARKAKALGMGGPDKLAKRAAPGVLDARSRLDLLLDAGSFVESGLFATSFRAEDRDRTPADGKVAGFGRIEGRDVGVVSNDFTVLGASSSQINGKKIKHVKDIANAKGLPMVFLGESAGARIPDRMGSAGRAILGQDPTEYQRIRTSPWVSAQLGACFGSSTWYGCMSDFVVMRKGALMAVASHRVTSSAISQEVDPEELGRALPRVRLGGHDRTGPLPKLVVRLRRSRHPVSPPLRVSLKDQIMTQRSYFFPRNSSTPPGRCFPLILMPPL